MSIRTYLEQVGQDLRYALRMTAAKPAFAAMAVLSLALGMAASRSACRWRSLPRDWLNRSSSE